MIRANVIWSATRFGRWPVWATILLAAAQMVQAQSILGTNLIVNGNAEMGPASPDGKAIVGSIPGWTRTGNANVLPYDLTGFILLKDPAPQDHGFQYFYGGQGGASTLTQTIDVSSGASTISGGNVTFTASAYLGGVSGGRTAKLEVAFQNAGGQTFSSVTLGPLGITATPGLTLQRQIGVVPSGTVRITVTLTFSALDAAADSLSLMLSPPSTVNVLGINLITNPGAEDGPSAVAPAVTLYIPGWSTTDVISVAPYGGTGWISPTAPGPMDRGVKLFCKTVSGDGVMYQYLDVSPAAALIDAGKVSYQVSAWLGNLSGTSPTLVYSFFDWSGTQLAATAQLGPLNRTGAGLDLASHSGTLPAGTRRVNITLNMLAGTFDAMADNIGFTLTAAAPPSLASVLSAGAFGGFTAIAPGSWIEIYGSNFTANSLGWSGSDFVNGVAPTQLGGVTVSIGGKPAFIDYVSSGQVNALVSSDVPIGATTLTVSNPNGASNSLPLTVNTTEPGLLAPPAFQVGGKQYLAALFADGSFAIPQNAISGVASRPAKPGDTLIVYGVGFGPVVPAVPAGTVVTQGNALATPVQFTVGTAPATVTYDGLVPSYTGLYQFNIVVPNVAANDAVPISFTLGGAQGSQTLYIAVQN